MQQEVESFLQPKNIVNIGTIRSIGVMLKLVSKTPFILLIKVISSSSP